MQIHSAEHSQGSRPELSYSSHGASVPASASTRKPIENNCWLSQSRRPLNCFWPSRRVKTRKSNTHSRRGRSHSRFGKKLRLGSSCEAEVFWSEALKPEMFALCYAPRCQHTLPSTTIWMTLSLDALIETAARELGPSAYGFAYCSAGIACRIQLQECQPIPGSRKLELND
jgi:hypothetical protein